MAPRSLSTSITKFQMEVTKKVWLAGYDVSITKFLKNNNLFVVCKYGYNKSQYRQNLLWTKDFGDIESAKKYVTKCHNKTAFKYNKLLWSSSDTSGDRTQYSQVFNDGSLYIIHSVNSMITLHDLSEAKYAIARQLYSIENIKEVNKQSVLQSLRS